MRPAHGISSRLTPWDLWQSIALLCCRMPRRRESVAAEALKLVSTRFSWDGLAIEFEKQLPIDNWAGMTA
jgi:hypothetical protein